ncbi:MSMEG_1061 family FMN-dependent PPOX-type flavoprotein [Hydrogenophaga sp. PAMC20947]|uniref:MSMEG_1061 family FMN-dependent PPOX-type flavoprotein n=1 Tax=Hydrogenophaga sp. PAMC20947 TaxID=2565558 RepID=UPI00109DE72C|nr:MSMEG_1061 family FMN-dependent PPOX-type flavoprotein [Hydrogenophaga sp. PAMC20947]QCB46317.1 pyridoxamine 5'-phosphate oxidase family protein [Hydrogenophaga sp. PAMC20947]
MTAAPSADPTGTLTSVAALRALYGPKRGRSARKAMPRLDSHATRLIGLSPFVVIASGHADLGEMDASPRGGEPGFVKAPDAHTLLIPDAPGNNLLDTLENIASHGPNGAPVGLVFLLPGMDETLRVNGLARLSTQAPDRQRCAEAQRLPPLAIRIEVQSCYVHCAKALMRAQLWDPGRHIQRSELPSLGEMLRDQLREFHGEDVAAESQAEMEERYRQTL